MPMELGQEVQLGNIHKLVHLGYLLLCEEVRLVHGYLVQISTLVQGCPPPAPPLSAHQRISSSPLAQSGFNQPMMSGQQQAMNQQQQQQQLALQNMNMNNQPLSQNMNSAGQMQGMTPQQQMQQMNMNLPYQMQNMNAQQRHFMQQQQQKLHMQQQQRAMFNQGAIASASPGPSGMEPPPVPIRASSLGRATQSPTDTGSPSNQQTSFNIAPPHTAHGATQPQSQQAQSHALQQQQQQQHSGISPINTMMGGRAVQSGMVGGWSGNPGATTGQVGGYVGSPLNPGWSPQAVSNNPQQQQQQQHHGSASSPLSGGGGGSGFGMGHSTSSASPAREATPHHPGTPASGIQSHQGLSQQQQQHMMANNGYDMNVDTANLFNEWTT